MIRFVHVTKRFKRNFALHDVSAEIPNGRVVSLIGPNGSGKTTLIKSFLGMVTPDSGDIYFDNQLIRNQYKYRDRIGYMPQIGRYPDHMKIGQVINMIQNIRGVVSRDMDNDLFNAFEIESIRNKSMQSLSGGTRQKVSATIAFMFNPDVYVLDEPTAGLDPMASEILKEKIIKEKRKGKLILLTSHILSDLEELTTDIMYLNEGKLQFFETLDGIRDLTGEQKLSKAIAALMERNIMNKRVNIQTDHLTKLSSS